MKNKSIFILPALALFLFPLASALTAITDCTGLQNMQNNLAEDYRIDNAIDCVGTQPFLPVGNFSATFTGSLDGQNFAITNLLINSTSDAEEYVGLIGFTGNSVEVKNILLVSPVVIKNNTNPFSAVGSVVGFAGGGNFTNLHVTGGTLNVGDNDEAGGVIGDTDFLADEFVRLEHLSYDGTITAPGAIGGGVVGNDYSGNVANIYNNITSSGTITAPLGNMAGLFGTMNLGTLSNSSSSMDINGGGEIGGLVGFIEGGGIVENSFATGTMNGTIDNVGGLVAATGADVIIRNSYATGDVIGDNTATDIGGLVGDAEGGGLLIENSWSSGDVIGDTVSFNGENHGGLVGRMDGGIIDNSNASGNIVGSFPNGGLIGYTTAPTNITNSHHRDGIIFGGYGSGGLIGLTDVEARITDSFSTAVNITVVDGGDSSGGLVGDGGTTVIIERSYSTADVISDFGYAGGLVGITGTATITDSWATGDISYTDLATGQNAGGLVGWAITSATIDNSNATGDVTGLFNTGGLVGRMTTGSIDNSFATGNIDGELVNGEAAGGLVGYIVMSGTVNNSFATGTVETAALAGGLVGWGTRTNILNSFYTGSSVTAESIAGGVIGLAEQNTTFFRAYSDGATISAINGGDGAGGILGDGGGESIFIDQSWSTSTISAAFGYAGGLTGLITDGTITDSFATGSVTVNDVDGEAAGGLVASMNNNIVITRSYASGAVNLASPPAGTNQTGGLVGQSGAGTVTCVDSFWDTERTGQSLAMPDSGECAGAVGKTTEEMNTLSTYIDSGWDMALTDTIANGNYPFFETGSVTLWSLSIIPPTAIENICADTQTTWTDAVGIAGLLFSLVLIGIVLTTLILSFSGIIDIGSVTGQFSIENAPSIIIVIGLTFLVIATMSFLIANNVCVAFGA